MPAGLWVTEREQIVKLQPPWRAMSSADIDVIHAISRAVHPMLPEDREVFANRLDLYPGGMHVLEADGTPSGYCVGHPWCREKPLPLDSLVERLPDAPDTFYLHDLALLPAARGRGFADSVVEYTIARVAESGLPELSLIAVGGSAPFWEKFGFRQSVAQPDKLAGYGEDARYLTLVVGPEPTPE